MNKLFTRAICLLMLASQIHLANAGEAVTHEPPEPLFDGPYLFEPDINERLTANWICANKLVHTQVKHLQVTRPTQCGQLPEPKINLNATQVSADVYTHVSKIVALSDIHGQFDVLITLLKNQKIIDKNHNWAFGDGHMVMTGDIFDRGHQVNEVLWFMYKLDRQATAAGGKLHLLMGNHEQMVMQGDLRYIHKRYQLAEELLGRSYDELYDASSVIGQWLRSKHTIVKLNDNVFLHGGISGEWVDRGLTIDKANSLYRAHIDDGKANIKQDDLLKFLFYSGGPTWFRGYFKPDFDEAELDKILSYLEAKRIVVGHTSKDRVLGLFDNRVIAIDSSIKNGESGELLLIQDNVLTRGLYDGTRQAL